MSLALRVGHGYDVHRFEDAPSKDAVVWLGGIAVPHTHRVIAHSDGDLIIHALCDALLGAVALGDIGRHFPDTDVRWAGLSGATMVARVLTLIRDVGYCPAQVDCTLVAQRPRVSTYVPAMVAQLAKLLDIPVSAVNVKATTTERLGPVGREEGIAAHAVATVARVE